MDGQTSNLKTSLSLSFKYSNVSATYTFICSMVQVHQDTEPTPLHTLLKQSTGDRFLSRPVYKVAPVWNAVTVGCRIERELPNNSRWLARQLRTFHFHPQGETVRVKSITEHHLRTVRLHICRQGCLDPIRAQERRDQASMAECLPSKVPMVLLTIAAHSLLMSAPRRKNPYSLIIAIIK